MPFQRHPFQHHSLLIKPPLLQSSSRRCGFIFYLLFLTICMPIFIIDTHSNAGVQAASVPTNDKTDTTQSKDYSSSSNHKSVTGATTSNSNIFPAIDDFSSHSVIRPKIHHARHKREIRHTLDTDGLHVPHITLTYHHKGQRILIDLKRNDNLLPDEHFLRYQNSNLTQGHVVKNFTKTEIELCHYQGSIRDQPQSYVAVSTCNGGINGIIFDGIDTYFIHSGSDGQLYDEHFLFRHDDFVKNSTCGYDHEHNEEKQDFLKNLEDNKIPDVANHIDGAEFNRILRHKRSYDDSNMIRGPYNSNKHSSYVEIVIVVDNKAFKSFNENIKKVHQHCKDLANIMNALYVPLNIFIALVGVVIWNESNEIEITPDADITLRNFLNYRRTKLVLQHPNDSAQLLTKIKFDKGVVGKAFKGPICTHEYSGSVNVEHSPVVGVVATTMAHELGHNFGMEHDSSDCKCQDEKCIMSASSTSVLPTHWSSCSIDQLNIAFSRGMNYCLRNKPTKLFDSPQCGNGFVEPGEQCDCGLPNYCENTCCDPYTCMLHTNASCATGECCDLNTCRPKMAGTECRNAENECDLPEYCTGESEYCPLDVFKRDTEECDKGQAYCYQGNCRSHSYQCRVLWGPTGENSEPCYSQMNVQGKRGGNCGYNRLNNTFIPCEEENALCGMLHCRHLNERLEFGMETAAVLSHSFITHENNIVPCRAALVDLGLQSTDPGLTPNGAKCGDSKMCVDQKCLTIDHLRYTGMGKECPEDCNGNGICNSKGNCHCSVGFTGATCKLPGPGGSVDSGPATNPNSHEAFQRFMYIFFFAVLPVMAAFCFFMYYCRHHPFFVGGKLAENIIKSASGNKQPPSRGPNGNNSNQMQPNGLPKSTPSSTDDMNSALLKSNSDSADVGNGGLYGKFKGFTLRPLNDATSPTNQFTGPNVAYVQPTLQDNTVPQRSAPPPPIKQNDVKLNGTLTRKAPAPPLTRDAPALPPPNPGSTARPIISMPVLENSTLTMSSPTRPAPTAPPGEVLKPAPPPPVPLHNDPKLNVKRDGTIRRITSFLKKEDKQPVKEKTYIDREKLKNLEISAPMPMNNSPPGESSNSDSETALSPKEEETKNLVKRAQSMRSPTKKPNIQTFGSMRQTSQQQQNRPRSAISSQTLNAVRPKSPPPRPPALKKTNSTTSSGYQLPITIKRGPEHTYDDCEFVEPTLASVKEQDSPIHRASTATDSDNIYSVIDEIPPASQTLKRSDLVGSQRNSVASSSDLGLLGEIVNEIEKRNGGDSIYSAAATNLVKQKSISKEESSNKSNKEESLKDSTIKESQINTNNKTSLSSNNQNSYLRPAPVNAPIARVAPTRSDLSPTTAFSSFKPPPHNSSALASTTASQNRIAAGASSGLALKAKGYTPKLQQQKSLPTSNGSAITTKPSATIQKPKPISAKPSFNSNQQQKKPTKAPTAPTTAATTSSSSAKKLPASSVASLTQRFEPTKSNGSSSSTSTTSMSLRK